MNFLIRTKENRITGPFAKEVVITRMQSGELREMDEVCPASGYWIFLHERDESLKMLGVALARTEEFHEESTETDTETVTATAPMAAPYVGTFPGGVTAHDAAHAEVSHREPLDHSGGTKEHPPTGNRPEAIRTLKFVLWFCAALITFILLRVYQVANPF